MARRGRPKPPVVLSDMEREALLGWSRRAKSSQALALRCRIVLGCAQEGGLRSNTDVAAELGVWPQTVTTWRTRFLDKRLDGLADEPRPGAPRAIDDERIEEVIVKTLEATPANATHWSRASMATETGLSRSTIGRIWKSFGLKPHQVDTFKISNDPQFNLVKLDKEVPAELDVHLICDNYSTHKSPTITTWLAAHPRFHMHFTPTYSSWLNQVERWFGLLTDKKLRRGAHKSVQALERDIRDWITNWNNNPKPFAWTKTADEILERLASYLQRIPGAEH